MVVFPSKLICIHLNVEVLNGFILHHDNVKSIMTINIRKESWLTYNLMDVDGLCRAQHIEFIMPVIGGFHHMVHW